VHVDHLEAVLGQQLGDDGLVTFLQRKQVEALAIHEPLVSKLLAEGKFRIVFALNDEWKKAARQDWLFLGAAAHRDWLTQNRPAARRLGEMLLEAMRNLSRNPDLVEAEATASSPVCQQGQPTFRPVHHENALMARHLHRVLRVATNLYD